MSDQPIGEGKAGEDAKPPSVEIRDARGLLFGDGGKQINYFYAASSAGSAKANENRPPVVVFAAHPSYPDLEFSVVNGGSLPIQLTSVRVVKAASIKADYGSVHFLTGPRVKLEFDLRSAVRGKWTSAFSGRVSNLMANEAEAFVLNLSAVNTLNLVDIELEYVSSATRRALVLRPPEVIFVNSPYPDQGWAGSIQLVARSEALSALLGEIPVPLRGPVAEAYPDDIRTVLLRAAAHLCFGEIAEGWNRISEKLSGSNSLGPAAASFAEFGSDHGLPPAVRGALQRWVSNPDAVRKAQRWDNESHAMIVQDFLVEGLPSRPGRRKFEITQGAAMWLSLLDSTMAIPPDAEDYDGDFGRDKWGELFSYVRSESTLHENREALARRLVDCYGKGAVEYLIVNLGLVSNSIDGYVRLLVSALGDDPVAAPSSSVDAILEGWRMWWDANHGTRGYSELQWRPHSPRLARAATALFARSPKEVPAEMDSLVKMAIVRNPHVIDHFAARLAKAPEDEIRMELAMSKHTPSGVLAILADDPHSGIRRWVASNPNADDQTLRKLGQDKSGIVRSFLSQNPRIPKSGA